MKKLLFVFVLFLVLTSGCFDYKTFVEYKGVQDNETIQNARLDALELQVDDCKIYDKSMGWLSECFIWEDGSCRHGVRSESNCSLNQDVFNGEWVCDEYTEKVLFERPFEKISTRFNFSDNNKLEDFYFQQLLIERDANLKEELEKHYHPTKFQCFSKFVRYPEIDLNGVMYITDTDTKVSLDTICYQIENVCAVQPVWKKVSE